MTLPAPAFSVCVETESATPLTRVCIGGDIDMAADDALHEVVRSLAARKHCAVHVDIAAVSFAGTTLINFLVRASTAIGPDPPIVLFGASPTVRRLLEMVGLGSLIAGHEPVTVPGNA